MTTREQIIAAAKECFDCLADGRGRTDYSADEYGIEKFYAIAFEAGRVAEREPKTRKVKMECFLIDGELHWRDENLSVLSHWVRQPHLDMLAKVPECEQPSQ